LTIITERLAFLPAGVQLAPNAEAFSRPSWCDQGRASRGGHFHSAAACRGRHAHAIEPDWCI